MSHDRGIFYMIQVRAQTSLDGGGGARWPTEANQNTAHSRAPTPLVRSQRKSDMPPKKKTKASAPVEKKQKKMMTALVVPEPLM